MKQVKKVKFYTDKDGTEWTFKPLRIMTKIDIIKILDLLKEREPFYCEVATHVVPTDTRSAKVVAQQIVSSLEIN